MDKAEAVDAILDVYLERRDFKGHPAAFTLDDLRGGLQKAFATLGALPPVLREDAMAYMGMAALEAHLTDSWAPIRDMVGGWIAIAEVKADPEAHTALTEDTL